MLDPAASGAAWPPVRPGAPFCARVSVWRGPVGPVAFDWFELVVVLEGTGLVALRDEDERVWVRPGSVVVLLPNVPCGIVPDGEARVARLFYRPEFLVDQIRWADPSRVGDRWSAWDRLERAAPSQVVEVGGAERAELGALAGGLAATAAAGPPLGGYLNAASRALRALGMVEERLATGAEHGLFQDAGGGAGRATEPCFGRVRPVCDQVRAAVVFLREHHCEKVTLEVLARRVGLSRSQLAALFAEQIGKTPNAYQRLLRVRHMAELLRETELSVESVCREVGWADPSKAARVFKEATTMTPSEYRRKFAHPLPGPAGRAGHRPEQADRPINQADRLVFRA